VDKISIFCVTNFIFLRELSIVFIAPYMLCNYCSPIQWDDTNTSFAAEAAALESVIKQAAAMEAEVNLLACLPTALRLDFFNMMRRLQTETALRFVRFIQYGSNTQGRYRNRMKMHISLASRPISLTASAQTRAQQAEYNQAYRTVDAQRLVHAAAACSKSLKRLEKNVAAASEFDGLVESIGLSMQDVSWLQPHSDASPARSDRRTGRPGRLASNASAVLRRDRNVVSSAIASFRRMKLKAAESSSSHIVLLRRAQGCAEALDRLVEELLSCPDPRVGGGPVPTLEALRRIGLLENELRDAQCVLKEAWRAVSKASRDLKRAQAVALESVHRLKATVLSLTLRDD
jgi:hypothetical protein